MSKKLAALTFAAAGLLVMPAAASTILYSGTVDESEGFNTPAGGADTTLADFSNNPSDPTFGVNGDTTVFGYVSNGGGTSAAETDGWSIDFGSDIYSGTFSWSRVGAFDGELVVGRRAFQLPDFLSSGTIDLGDLTGLVTFSFNPVAGTLSGGEAATWELGLTAPVSAVPLPAGSFLLLTGVAGVAALRRKKASA